MKIGVGVITMGVRQLHPNLRDKTRSDAHFAIYTDAERKGPSHARNACLQNMQAAGCTHMFVFDDDCYPMMQGWEAYFIEQSQQSGIEFFVMPEFFRSEALRMDGEIVWWKDRAFTQFALYTPKTMETVGYYNTAYHRYGFEDPAYIERCKRAGLCGDPAGDGYPSPLRMLAYIHPMDVYAENPTPNMTTEEKQACIAQNKDIYIAEIAGPQLYYPPS